VPELIASPSRVEAAGNMPKVIEEFVGRVNSGTAAVSIANGGRIAPDTVHRDP
jgi:hypothetical protein